MALRRARRVAACLQHRGDAVQVGTAGWCAGDRAGAARSRAVILAGGSAAKVAAALKKPASKKVTASNREKNAAAPKRARKRATSKKCDESEVISWPARAVSSQKLTCLIFSAYMCSLSLARPSSLSAFEGCCVSTALRELRARRMV